MLICIMSCIVDTIAHNAQVCASHVNAFKGADFSNGVFSAEIRKILKVCHVSFNLFIESFAGKW